MLPIILIKNLDSTHKDKWVKQFVVPGRQKSEGLWRRTQQEETKEDSGWRNESDARRRMVHYIDEYDVIDNSSGQIDFVIKNVYLWVSVTLPKHELAEYERRVMQALSNKWVEEASSKFRLHDLQLNIEKHEIHPEDTKAGRHTPNDYGTLEFTVVSDGMIINDRVIDSPWKVLSSGIRKKDDRSDKVGIINNLKILKKYIPMQVELGGGASIDLGIPPLNHLHQIYNVTHPDTGAFIFTDDPLLPNLLRDPVEFYKKASLAYRRSLLAHPNGFYALIKELYDNGQVVGDIITNNFDGLTSLVGLKEKYVRRFDEPKMYPEIDFDKSAKSLLVVGTHADRRKIQKQARERGMKIIYVDPEKYLDYYGNEIDYPLEGADDNDIIIHMTANEFADELRKVL